MLKYTVYNSEQNNWSKRRRSGRNYVRWSEVIIVKIGERGIKANKEEILLLLRGGWCKVETKNKNKNKIKINIRK